MLLTKPERDVALMRRQQRCVNWDSMSRYAEMSDMSGTKFALGLDFGTESGRALLVDVATGREVANAVYRYADGVIDEKLPGTSIRLEPDWALQNPADYIETLRHAVPEALKLAGG